MFQLNILSGKRAGTIVVARRFPFRAGRDPGADLPIEEPGVWDQHLEFDFISDKGILLSSHPEAPAIVNGSRVSESLLKNGDTIEIGALKMRFWLSEIAMRPQAFREGLTWVALAVLFLGQFALMYWLSR